MAVSLKTRAVILRRVDYGEADRILTVITPQYGELAVMAKGVRRAKSKLAGGVELLAECELGLVKGSSSSSGMWTLTSSDIVEFYGEIIKDYDRLQFAYQMLKQVNDLGEFIDTPELFTYAVGTLWALNNSAIDMRLTKAWLLLGLTKLKGGELNLLTDSHGERLMADKKYNYSIAARAFTPAENGKFGANEIKLLRLLSSEDYRLLARLRVMDSKVAAALYIANVALESC